MRLQLWSALFLLQTCCVFVWAVTTSEQHKQQDHDDMLLIRGEPIISSRARAARIAEFVSSHKIPDNLQRKDAMLFERRHDGGSYDDDEQLKDDRSVRDNAGKDRVELEDLGKSGSLFGEESLNRRNFQYVRQYNRQDELLSGVRLSSESSTTMFPLLTTPREMRPFDFVPVNVIRDDAKGTSFLPFDTKNFEDLGDVSLIPAGSNTRIQVKKGPNGKDYEYEYVYYYYDEEDEGKASGGATASNSQEVPMRTAAPSTASSGSSSRRGNGNRNRYSTLEKMSSTTTIEPVVNEVIPSGNGNRARQLEAGHEEVTEERLPTNTRFPPRSRANQAVETTEHTSRARGNRNRGGTHEVVDSSSFRGHLEGPEFPQNLPNGPVRFLGVTPNEGNESRNEEKSISRSRGKPQRIQEPAPVQEAYEDTVYSRKRPASFQYDNQDKQQLQQERDQTQSDKQQAYLTRDEESGTYAAASPTYPSPKTLHEESYTDYATELTDSPTTQVPSAMQKVALDLYAFLQQGRSNLVDFIREADEDSTDSGADSQTTELPGTTLSSTEAEDPPSTLALLTTTPTTTTTSTTSTTTTTTTTPTSPPSSEEPSSVAPGISRGKFRRPGVPGGGQAISRNRFKSGHTGPSSTEASTGETTATGATLRARGRFGSPTQSNAGFKRSRPKVQKNQTDEEQPAQKESAEKVSSEAKPTLGRGRYRGSSARSGVQQPKPTHAVSTENPTTIATSPNGLHRPAGLSKLNGIGRRRGSRPGTSTTAVPAPDEVASEHAAPSLSLSQENSPAEPQRTQTKVPIGGTRPKTLTKPIIRPGSGRLNLRPRIGQQPSTTTTEQPADVVHAEAPIDEPASEGTEEEHRHTAAETSPPVKASTVNPLNKLRNRNKIQVQPKTITARTPLPLAARRSPLLPRRRTTEAPVELEPATSAQLDADEEVDSTESQLVVTPEVSSTPATSSSPKHEESRGLSSLLAPRRRIAPRRPGQLATPSE